MPSLTPADARHAANLSAELAQVLAEAVALSPTPIGRLYSAKAATSARRAGIAAAYAEIARSPVAEALAIADAFRHAAQVSTAAGIAYRAAGGLLDS